MLEENWIDTIAQPVGTEDITGTTPTITINITATITITTTITTTITITITIIITIAITITGTKTFAGVRMPSEGQDLDDTQQKAQAAVQCNNSVKTV
jgi:hypothetical protein